MTDNPEEVDPQPATDLWQSRIEASRDAVDALEPLFDDALSVAKMRIGDTAAWSLEALFDGPPAKDDLQQAIASTAAEHGFEAPSLFLAELEQRDWLAENQAALKVMDVGQFRIVPEHRSAETPPSHHYRIVLDAGPAFGSGTHETTRSCLLLMLDLARRARPRRILDVGTGSGILAIGAALMWKVKVTATDIDPVAISTAIENAGRNRCAAWIIGAVGAGVEPVVDHGRYDLVIANILARPLAGLAQDIAGKTASSGYVILSGILSSQENQVLAPYRNAGFALQQRMVLGPWSSYLMRKA